MTLLCFRLGFAEVYILLNKYYIVQLLALKKYQPIWVFSPLDEKYLQGRLQICVLKDGARQ